MHFNDSWDGTHRHATHKDEHKGTGMGVTTVASRQRTNATNCTHDAMDGAMDAPKGTPGCTSTTAGMERTDTLHARTQRVPALRDCAAAADGIESHGAMGRSHTENAVVSYLD